MPKKKNVIAPDDETSVVAMEKMAVDIQKARELYGDDEPFEEERVLDCIVFRAERADCEIERLGKYCLWYQAEAGHGKFLAGLKRRNINVRGAYHAMAMIEAFGAKFATVANLGTRKARCLTAFTKEEIDEYVKGGPLRTIPHDDVANMTTAELEKAVRELKKELAQQKEAKTKAIARKEAKINELEELLDRPSAMTKEQKAATTLQKFNRPYAEALVHVIAAIGEARNILREAEKTPHIDELMLSGWLSGFDELMQTVCGSNESWLSEVDNAAPIEVGKIIDGALEGEHV